MRSVRSLSPFLSSFSALIDIRVLLAQQKRISEKESEKMDNNNHKFYQ